LYLSQTEMCNGPASFSRCLAFQPFRKSRFTSNATLLEWHHRINTPGAGPTDGRGVPGVRG